MMKQRLLKTIALGLMAMVGVNAWADTFSPTADVYFRTSLSESTYSWSSGYPKTAATLGDNNMAGNYRNGMFALQKYSVDNLKAANKITLKVKRVTSGGGDALGIWAFSTNNWSNESTAATLAPAVNNIVGLDLNTTGTPSNSPLVDGTNTITDDVCSFAISGTALTTLKETATYDGTTGTFTLLITNKTSDMSSGSSGDRKFYGSGHSTEANRPYIDVDFYPVAIGNTAYATLNAAASAATDGQTITIYKDVELSANITFAESMNIVPAKAGLTLTISTSMTGNYYAFGLATASKTVSIGSETLGLTIDGQSTTLSSDRKLFEVTNGQLNLTNVILKNVYSSASQGVVCCKSSGKVQLTDVTFNGCQATATDAGIVFCGTNDAVILSGNNTFTGCTGYGLYLEKRFHIDETNGISNTTPISIYVKTANIALGGVVATKSDEDDVTRFVIKNAGYGLYKNTGSGRQDLKCCEGYPLQVTSAGAATLCLPYATTIPTGVTCYTLTYPSGGEDITATGVTGGTLNANTPVLVIANAGLYYMLNSTKATTATSFTASDTPTSGVLTGVYQETVVPADNYILTNHSGTVGFRKANGSTNKVKAYHAYMTASYSAGAPDFLGINFDGDVTAIDTVEKKAVMDDGEIYNLQGIRMTGSNLQKGIYVKNGKKFIVK